jgi:hypothetical protein
MRPSLVPGAFALLLSLACATSAPPGPQPLRVEAAAPSAAVDGEWEDGKAAAPESSPEGSGAEPAAGEAAPDYRTYRLGFWEFDLFALDVEPRGTTFRMLDLAIFKLLEVGSGPDYHSFALVEIPPLFSVFSTRHEEDTGELKLADVSAFGVAVVRHTRDSETEYQTHVLKLPVLGSFFGLEREDTLEKQHFLYLFRREVEE